MTQEQNMLEPEAGAAWMWLEDFDSFPGTPFNSTTDREVAKAMSNLGFDVVTLVPTPKCEASYRSMLQSILAEGEGK